MGEQPIKLIDYKGRGGGQIVRFLLEYFNIAYEDISIDIPESISPKTLFSATYFYPMIKDEDFTVEGIIPVSKYICRKAGRYDLLGKSAQDGAKIQQLLMRKQQYKNSILLQVFPRRQLFLPQNRAQLLKITFEQPFRKQLLIELQKLCQNKQGSLGYLTVLDFFIYEMSFKIGKYYSQIKSTYPNLFIEFFERFESNQNIKKYLLSGRLVDNNSIIASSLQQCKWKLDQKQ